MSTKRRKAGTSEAQAHAGPTGKQQLEMALARCASNLWHELRDDDGMYRRLSVSKRADGTFLAVLSTTDADDQAWAAFGAGDDVVGALVALNKSIAKDAWKEDKLVR